jgi:hypothetical protein
MAIIDILKTHRTWEDSACARDGNAAIISGPNATHVWSGRLQFSVRLK